jgi:glycosyltransferase involved in cell wall biosynthesis
MPSPPSRPGGHYYGLWATAIVQMIWPHIRLVIPGRSREQERVYRFARETGRDGFCRFVEDRFSPAELIAASDGLLVPALDDIATDWLAWAMAGSVPIIGSAVPAVAELIADRHNGLLCKPGEPHTLAIRIRRAFEDRDTLARCVETARGQAFEVFRAQRCIDEHLRVIDNVAAGQPAVSGLQDAAIDA